MQASIAWKSVSPEQIGRIIYLSYSNKNGKAREKSYTADKIKPEILTYFHMIFILLNFSHITLFHSKRVEEAI